MCSATAICYKGNKVLEIITAQVTQQLETFSLRMCRNGYLGAFSQKYDPAIRPGYQDFL